ncbi:MAG: YeeE/YedE family protein [Rhodobacteraceae bacterium]|nr:YeeE/YedE family protein [Paracoccaceae bacterium]
MDVISALLPDGYAAGMFGLIGGAMLGMAARYGRFCTLGAIEDAIYAQDYRRARMWAVALGVAILGVFVLEALGEIDLSQTLYASAVWNPVASVVGGLLFGYGMAIAGNCGFGALSRAAGGEMRSFVVAVVMGIAAYMTLGGPLASLRQALFSVERTAPEVETLGIAHAAAAWTGAAPLWIAIAVVGLLLIVALASSSFRASPGLMAWGAVVGVAVVLGWWGSAAVARTGFEAGMLESHSFTAPLGESLLYLMTSTGGGFSFGVGSVAGVVLGSLLACLAQGHFRWEACDDPRELGRQLFGAFLMGVGGVIALGCSIGQGLTAFSTLSVSAPVVTVSIIAGAALGLRQLISGGIGQGWTPSWPPAWPRIGGERSDL